MSIRDIISGYLTVEPAIPYNVSPRRYLFQSLTTAQVAANTAMGFAINVPLSDTLHPADAIYIESWIARVAGGGAGSWTLEGAQFSIVNQSAQALLYLGQPSTTIVTAIVSTLQNQISTPLIFQKDLTSFGTLQSLAPTQPFQLSSFVTLMNGTIAQTFGVSFWGIYRLVQGLEN